MDDMTHTQSRDPHLRDTLRFPLPNLFEAISLIIAKEKKTYQRF